MARKRKPRHELPPDDDFDDELEDDLDDEDDNAPPLRPRRRRRNWRLRFVVLLLLVAGLIAAAPTIVAKTPLRNFLLGRALPGASAQLAARDASFSWTGAQGLTGVTLADAQGNPLTTIELISVDRSLVSLAAGSRNLGKISILRPVIHLETRDGGSNFEDLLQNLAEAARQQKPTTPRDSGPTTAEIEITDGVIHGRDAATGQEWRIDQFTATAKTTPAGDLADVTGAGVLTLTSNPAAPPANEASPGVNPPGPPNAPGHFQFRLTPRNTDDPNSTARQLELIADRLPLAPLEPWLARVLPESRLTGAASADLKLAWTSPTPSNHKAGDGIAGPLPSDLQPLRISASGKFEAADLRFTAAALEGDLVEFPTAALAIDAKIADGQLSAKQLKAQCDWLKAEGSGDFNLAQFTGGDWRQLPAGDAELTASVDLPQLARMLPRTLKLRPGVKIDSGNIEVTARSERSTNENSTSEPGGSSPRSGEPGGSSPRSARRWTVAASIDNLLGTDGKRAIRWTQPVEAGFDAAETADGPQLTRAILRSAFASATAEAVDEGYRGELAFNLDQLAEQLGQFVDLSQWKLAGAGTGDFTLRNTGDDRFVAVAKLNLTGIDVRTQGRIVWLDPELRLEASANGRRQGLRPYRLETAAALMRSPHDTLEAELIEPVDLAAADRQYAIRIKGDGPLDAWAGRLRPWVAAVPDELSGASTVSAELRAGPGLVEVVSSQLKVRDFRTRIGAVEVIEPRLEAGGDFRWSAGDKAIQSQDLQFATSTVAARIGGLSLRTAAAGPPTVRGEIAFRGDLERLAAWVGLAGVDAKTWPRGHAVGRIDLTSDAQRANATLTLTAEPFTLVRAPSASAASRGVYPPGPSATDIAWHEPKLELSANAVYTSADDLLNLADIRLQGQTVQLTGRGSVEQLRTAGLVRGDVNVTYDAAEFAKLLTGYLGPGVRIEGANTARLHATGRVYPPPSKGGARGGIPDSTIPPHVQTSASLPSHWSQRWQVTTETGWSTANLYGLPIGAAKLAANLHDGQLDVTPLDLAVGQGRITAAPRTRLDPPPQEITFPPGPLASNVAISPEVSDAMLKYAAPVLASATRTEGSFSLFLDSGAQIPLGDPHKTRATGRLTIHRLSVLPGPMLQEIITLISRVEALSKRRPEGLLGALATPPATSGAKGVTMNERTIDIQIVDGRVYHRNLEFLVDDVPVRSFGSVGFDQTLALEIEVPIQAKWVGSERALQPLIGQVIKIPVTGTFTRWKVDERAIGNFLGQAAQTAVGGAIEGELNRALDKLFKPRN